MARRKPAIEEAQINVWPSSFPDEDVSSTAAANEDLSRDCDELGNGFLTDAVEARGSTRERSSEQSFSAHQQWDSELEDEPDFDPKMGDALLRSFGLEPMPKRTTTRPLAPRRAPLPKLTAPRMPKDFDDFINPVAELDLTEETIRDVSMMDHEAEEAGEVESPFMRTDDVHTHGKRRGGHARTSLRPPKR